MVSPTFASTNNRLTAFIKGSKVHFSKCIKLTATCSFVLCLPKTLTQFISIYLTETPNSERMTKAAILKEHPYSSHISRFALFPSFRSPDDPVSGVRAASQPVLNPLIPSSAPDVTVVSKTIGKETKYLKLPHKNVPKFLNEYGHFYTDILHKYGHWPLYYTCCCFFKPYMLSMPLIQIQA